MATKFITVSIEIMHDKNLTPNQKFILAEIMQLSSLEKGCIASNRHFSELIGITTMGASKAINDLSTKGYIIIDNAQTKRNFGRVITINSGKSPINSSKSDINSGLETKENKTTNTIKKKSIYDNFLELLKEKASIRSKVTTTKDTKKLFNSKIKTLEDTSKLFEAYLKHQRDKGEFAQRLTPYLLDYKPKEAIPEYRECDAEGNLL